VEFIWEAGGGGGGGVLGRVKGDCDAGLSSWEERGPFPEMGLGREWAPTSLRSLLGFVKREATWRPFPAVCRKGKTSFQVPGSLTQAEGWAHCRAEASPGQISKPDSMALDFLCHTLSSAVGAAWLFPQPGMLFHSVLTWSAPPL
jgi:hypothetical protein